MAALFTKDTKDKKSGKRSSGDKTPPTREKNSSLSIIKNPRLTEKSYAQSQKGKYIFDVLQIATKKDVKQGVESIYKVEVDKVAVVNVKAMTKRFGRTIGRTASKRKAIVTLKEGSVIDLFGDNK